ncbi:hypothetical protein F66182_7930 [Fusarium sp. NRRL 66182]|nr:hypothetical protein F66182_7930 [Fusarium sp. NRRL 66182]
MRALALSTALLAVNTLAQSNNQVECADGLYMIVARGTGEDEGTGITGEVAQDVANRVNGSIIEPLDYPATFTDPFYEDSESAGVEALTSALTTYHDACPDGKIAVFDKLLTTRQGGQVTIDTICGGSGGSFPDNRPISTDLVQDSVVAIIVFGDPSHVANASYNVGTGINDGIFEREDIKLCEDNYSDIIRSYCDTGDRYCDRGRDEDVHGSYVSKYGDEIVDFVVEQYESAARGDSSTTATGTSTAATSTAAVETATETTSEDAAATPTAVPANGAAERVPAVVFAIIPFIVAVTGILG